MLKIADSKERWKQIRDLYEASFPKSEKKPFKMILAKQKEGLCEILAVENAEGQFCGLAIMMLTGGLALLDYFAIAPQCRGAGLGGMTLRELQERYRGKKLVIEIERTEGPQAETAENAGDRIRRRAFYLRNGLTPTGLLVDLFGVEMEVLTYGTELTFDEYHSIYEVILPKFLLGKVRPVDC